MCVLRTGVKMEMITLQNDSATEWNVNIVLTATVLSHTPNQWQLPAIVT